MKKGILILLLCIVTSSGIYAQIGSKVDMDNIAASVIMQTWAYDAESFLLDFVEFDDKGRWTKANEYLYDIVTDQMVIYRIYSRTFYPGELFDEWDKENSSEIEYDF